MTASKPTALEAIEDVEEGAVARRTIVVSADMVATFGDLVDDHAPLHFDSQHASAMGYSDRAVHGLLLGGNFSTLMGEHLPGPNSVIQQLTLKYLAPVYIGSEVTFEVSVSRVTAAVNAVSLDLAARVGETTVVSGKAVCVMRTKADAETQD